jgi:hypothetical protein
MNPAMTHRAIISAVSLVAAGQLAGQAPSRDQRWREDVRFLASELPTKHKNAFAYLDKTRFDSEARNLDAAIPRLNDAQVQLRIARLAALIRDVHTAAQLPMYPLRMPFTIFWFETGPVIVNATDDRAALVGARIARVNGRDIRKVADTLRLYLSNENELGFWLRAGQLLLRPQALRDVGLGGDSASTTFELEKNGVTSTETIHGVQTEGFTLPPRDVPLYRRRAGEKYWWTYLPSERTVFVKYNQCRDPEDFKALTDSVATAIDVRRPLRVVVDLRDNSGGNSNVVLPLIDALKARMAINRSDALYVVIGRATLSSGLFAAVDLKENTRATVIGEPTGEHPNHYGELRVLKLPNSGIEVTYSTKFHELIEKNADAYAPDVLVPPTPESYLRGVDPAMEWILAHSRASQR